MRTRWLLAAAALAFAAAPLPAQRTADQARLLLTISAGYVGGGSLWEVGAQPIFSSVSLADTVALERRLRSRIGLGFSGAYFPGENLGFTADAFLVGLGLEDRCTYRYNSGGTSSGDIREACQSLQGSQKPGTAAMISGGVVYRVNSRKPVSPYVRGMLGLVISQQSPIATVGVFRNASNQPVDLVVYEDPDPKRVNFAGGVGAGFTAAIARGYQLRAEVRDNIVGIQKVDGATFQEGLVPPRSVTYKHVFSLTFGFDVVLERRRGRRY